MIRTQEVRRQRGRARRGARRQRRILVLRQEGRAVRHRVDVHAPRQVIRDRPDVGDVADEVPRQLLLEAEAVVVDRRDFARVVHRVQAERRQQRVRRD